MANKANDPMTVFEAAASASILAGDKLEASRAMIAKAYHDMLPPMGGYCDRLSADVVSWETIATSSEARKNVLDRILELSAFSLDKINAAKKVAKDSYDPRAQAKAAELAKARVYAMDAMEFFAAIVVLELKHKVSVTWATNGVMLPAQWFVPDGFILAPNFRITQFKLRHVKAADFVLCGVEDVTQIPEGHPGLWKFTATATISGVIELATGKKKETRQARPEGNASTGTTGEGEGTGNGTATGTGNAEAKPRTTTPTEARDVLAKEAARDDFKHAPTGVIKEDWQTFFDNVATNPHYRAMMVRAISRANKAEADDAAANSKAA